MQPHVVALACIAIVLLPARAVACGGCTDSTLLTTTPWAGLGIVLVWLWIVANVAARWCLRGRDADSGMISAWTGTLIAFALLGSLGYFGLVRLSFGSRLLPSMLLGFVWFAYLAIRIAIDAVRLVVRPAPAARTTLAFNAAFMLIVLLSVASSQTKAHSLDHQIACLRFGRNTVPFSPLVPGIVSHGVEAVAPLIRAGRDALARDDDYERANVLTHAAFCLERIGGPEAEQFLAELVRQYVAADDYSDRRWYRHVSFSYARAAGARAVPDLIEAFESMPFTEHVDHRSDLLVALTMTASPAGVSFALDHMDVLLKAMKDPSADRARVAQAAAECLVFDADPDALRRVPAHRDAVLMSPVSRPESPVDDVTAEFFWTCASERSLRPVEAIEAGWRDDATRIRERWSGLVSMHGDPG